MSENPYAAPTAALADPTAPGEVRLASLSRRFGGAFVDGLIGGALGSALLFATGYWSKILEQTATIADTAVVATLGFVLFLMLHGYTLARSGQTLGKVVAKTQIVSTETNQPIGLVRVAALRYLPGVIVQQIPIIGPFVGIADAVFVFRADRRCIHDLIAGTKVIDYRPAAHPI